MQSGHTSPDGRWIWNGMQWIANAPSTSGNPPGLALFRVYCILVAVVAGGFSALLLFGVAAAGFDPAKLGGVTSTEVAIFVALLVYELVYACGLIVAVVAPREPWAWRYGLVVIILGMLGFAIILAIPLAFYWITERMRAYYGMQA